MKTTIPITVMPTKDHQDRSFFARFMESACEQLPNCSKAISLAELGAQRELSFGEKLKFKYHGRLCPFCGCANGRFDAAKRNMIRETRHKNV